MKDIHHQYYSRLAPAIQKMAEESGSDFTAERRKALDQFIKTVLLGEVSPRLRMQGLTIERLVQLNAVDVEGETYRGQVRVAETDLLALSTRVPDLQVAGSGKTAVIRFVLGRVSLGEVLSRARSKVDNPAQRFKVFWGALRKALKIDTTKGFEDGGPNEGDWDLVWRRTKRRGHIKLGNVREMSQDDFDPPDGAFAVLVDYPWDEPGHTVDEDRMRASNARKKKGTLHTVCWLPRHMTPTELGVLTELAAVRYLLSDAGQEDLLETLGAQDKGKVLDQASVRSHTLEGQLEDLLKEVYVHHGEFHALISDVDPSRPRESLAENLDHIATLLMDRRYPQHPQFLAEPRRQDLDDLLKWMLEASDTNVSVAYDENTGRILKNLALPLELVNIGQTKASLRLDSRYIKDVLQRADQESLSWVPVAEHLRDTYGFQPLLVELFLGFLCQRDHRALGEMDGEAVEFRFGMPATTRLRLQRGKVLGGAEWGRLRDLGHQLFAIPRPAAHRSLQAQDRFAKQLREGALGKRVVLQGLHQRVVALGGEKGARAHEFALANQRLSPLAQNTTDSFKVLSDMLVAWPDDGADPIRSLVHQAESIRDALGELDEHARSLLDSGKAHTVVGSEVVDHLAVLEARLAAKQAEQPLSRDWVKEWNARARELTRRLVEQPKPVVGTINAVLPAPTSQASGRVLLLKERVEPADPASVDAFLQKVRVALSKVGKKSVTVIVGEDAE